MASRADFLRREYEGRVNRAIDWIYAHLDDPLDLDAIADAACFSRFHFHRIFSAMVGETIGDFVKRTRLERAASALMDRPRDSVTQIALDCGFSSPSVFARAFRERYGLSASSFREGGRKAARRKGSTGGQAEGSAGKASGRALGYLDPDGPGTGAARRTEMSELKYRVEVLDLPEMTVAYARHVGAYSGISEAFGRLMRWAGPRGLLRFPVTKSLAVYHDNPDVTEETRLRSDACVTVPAGTPVEGDIGLMTVPGGKFAVGHFEIAQDQFGAAWDALMGEWLPESGWQPDDRMCYELYLNDHETHPQKHFLVDICQPVKPL